uniref:Metallophos domain-containing protein n=1 Tax=Heterorhabditis bacteriophora TaxID=37862 RepID=A0A1I7X0W8_HETBA
MKLQNTTTNKKNKCHAHSISNEISRQAYVIEYTVSTQTSQMHIYKKCCWTNHCNDPNNFDIPLYYLKQPRSTSATSEVIIMIFLLGTLLMSGIPLYRSKNRQSVEINTDLEISGTLNIAETSHLIAAMTDSESICLSKSTVENEIVFNTAQLVKASRIGHTLLRLFDEAKDVFSGDETLLKITPPVAIIGDIRGSYPDLHRWLSVVGWPTHTRLLFLGNILDKDNPGSLECIALIAALKVILIFANTQFLKISPKIIFKLCRLLFLWKYLCCEEPQRRCPTCHKDECYEGPLKLLETVLCGRNQNYIVRQMHKFWI